MEGAATAPKVGARVRLKDKELTATVAYVGLTEFAAGKWIGLVLDEPKGKNNGSVQGKEYFKCKDKHGMFVRQTQIAALDEGSGGDGASAGGSRPASRASAAGSKDPSPKVTPTAETAATSATPTKLSTPRSAIPKPGAAGGPGGSRLPMPGKGPTGSRSPSFTQLKGAKKEVATPRTGMQKERSFVEKDFRQTVANPTAAAATPVKTPAAQVKPAASANVSTAASAMSASMTTGSPALTERMEEKIAAAQAQQELIVARDTIRDLEEKLETIKIKRAKDQEKLKEFEKIRIQHDQLVEFKSRIMESQASLQKELQRAKHEAKEAVEAKDKHAEEMAELSENVEMLTLDKEMAEEKAETLQIELEAAKEKVEELTLDLNIMKEEAGSGGQEGQGGDGGSASNFELKQQAAQTEKLRETLVRMRDLLAHEKNENMKMAKDLEEKTKSIAELSQENEKMSSRGEELENNIAELQEQVDAALGAEEMVENLTAKCLDMEDKLAAVLEEKEDLEKLHDLNEELQETLR